LTLASLWSAYTYTYTSYGIADNDGHDDGDDEDDYNNGNDDGKLVKIESKINLAKIENKII
jgi:hypothetical protein